VSEQTTTSGHTLKVTVAPDGLHLGPVCHESDGAWCRRACVKGCEDVCTDLDEHLEPVDYCLAAEWLSIDGISDSYAGDVEIALYDGMPIKLDWSGEGYEWTAQPDASGGAS
jgi:hypothetical protein